MSILQQNNRKKILLGEDGNSLLLLIVVNVLVFIFLSFIKIVYLVNNSTVGTFEAQVLQLLSLPAQPAVFATRPWTLLSYMFTHIGLWELISSMLWLWGFGYIFQSLTGNKKLIPVYLYGGLAGSVIFLLTVNLIPVLKENVNSVFPMSGAGPSLMAIAIATTSLAPRYRIFPMLNIPLWVLTAIFIIFRLGTVGAGNAGQAAALVAGGLMGYVFVWQLQKGNDWGQWMSDLVNWVDDLFNPQKKHVKDSPSKQLFYKSNQKPFKKTPHVTQQRVDDLLDKINTKGYHALTEDEKEFLKKASREEL
ncbi:rhomboid family intramembrane serine protease [Segetibacter koreensis]|uniref:rhomboid family intramembrane serine protease n=1 Tax=Segetibacter koreensis TaxID=398037 RepID=UPI000377492C|nr:rhomboid family intramembrane serine protease [Segetibacter koreensis]